MPHQRRASALGCRGRSPLAHQSQAGIDGGLPKTSLSEAPAIPENDAVITGPVSSGRPSVAPIHKKTRATGVDGTSQRLASSGSCGPRPRFKVRASPGAEAGDLRRESDRDPRPRPPPGGLGEPRRPETRGRATEQAAAAREPWRPETRSRAAEQAAAARGPWRPETRGRATEQSRHSPCASTRRRDRQSRNRRRRPAPLQWFRSNWTAAGAAGRIKTLLYAALNSAELRRCRADPRGAALPGLAGRVSALRAAPTLAGRRRARTRLLC